MMFKERDPRLDYPDPATIGLATIMRSAGLAAWDEQWRAATGLSWDEWTAHRDRYRPEPRAHIEVSLNHDNPRLSRVVVTRPGVLHCEKVRIDVSASMRGGIKFRVPLSEVTQA